MQRAVTTENCGTYVLDLIAVRELAKAKNARDAESIFERFAPDVPRAHRCDVWLACEEED